MAYVSHVVHKQSQRPFIVHTFTVKLSPRGVAGGGGRPNPAVGQLWPRGSRGR